MSIRQQILFLFSFITVFLPVSFAAINQTYTFICPQQATNSFGLISKSIYGYVSARQNGIALPQRYAKGFADKYYWTIFTRWELIGTGLNQRTYKQINQVQIECYYSWGKNKATMTSVIINLPENLHCKTAGWKVVRCN